MFGAFTEIHGHAIVTGDDRIADAEGSTPLALRNEADWTYFQAELDKADLIAIGRLAHEANPNFKQRRRLVLSRRARGLENRADAIWWNPVETPWGEVVSALLPSGGRIAVPGGQGVFDLFLSIGYDAFHLSRGLGVTAPGGRALFSACDRGLAAEAALARAGLIVAEARPLDERAHITLTIWRKP
jgi:hypothetical protein